MRVTRRGFFATLFAPLVARFLPVPASALTATTYPALKANVYGTSGRALTEGLLISAFDNVRRQSEAPARYYHPGMLKRHVKDANGAKTDAEV